MDDTTKLILEKIRLRKQQLDMESTDVSTTDQVASPTVEFRRTAVQLNPEPKTVEFDSCRFDLPEKDAPTATADENKRPGDAPLNEFKRASFYPLDELEVLAKQASDSVDINPVRLQDTTTNRAAAAIKPHFAQLAEKLSNFEYEESTWSKRRFHSPAKQSSKTNSPIASRQAEKSTPTSYADSGFKTFYRCVSKESTPSEVKDIEVEQSKESPLSPYIAAKVAPVSKSPSKTATLVTSQISYMSPKSKPTTSSGASSQRQQDTIDSAGKVASITQQWEKTVDHSPQAERKRPGEQKPAVRQPKLFGERERPLPISSQPPPKFSGGIKKKNSRLSSGVDTRNTPTLNKLRNRWEIASREGIALQADQSFSEFDNMSAAVGKLLKMRAPNTQHAAQTQRQPKEEMRKLDPPPIASSSPKSLRHVEPPSEVTQLSVDPPTLAPEIELTELPPDPGHLTVSSNVSDEKSIVSDLDGYLDEVINCAQEASKSPIKPPTPVSVVPKTTQITANSNHLPLMHTVSFYRAAERQATVDNATVKAVVKPPVADRPSIRNTEAVKSKRDKRSQNERTVAQRCNSYEEKAEELRRAISIQQEHIFQASRALNFCHSSEFRGSSKEIDVQRTLLIATETRRALLAEQDRLQERRRNRIPFETGVPEGLLTIHSIAVPLRKEFLNDRLHGLTDDVYCFVCILKCKDVVRATQVVDSEDGLKSSEVRFSDLHIVFDNLSHDFKITFELFAALTEDYRLEDDTLLFLKEYCHYRKAFLKVIRYQMLPDVTTRVIAGVHTSLGGPGAISDTSFTLAGHLDIDLSSIGRRRFSMRDGISAPVESSIYMELRCVVKNMELATRRGFLNRYREVGGHAAWQRLWCIMESGMLKFWMYPEDVVNDQVPIEVIDLKSCVSSTVESPPADFIAVRRNAFAFETDKCWHFMATDSNDDLRNWKDDINRSLQSIRKWTVS